MSGFERFKCEERMPPVETPVLVRHLGRWRVGEIRWYHPSWEELGDSFQYWDDPWNSGQDWDWDDITEWCHLPPDDEDSARFPYDVENDKSEAEALGIGFAFEFKKAGPEL